MIRAVTDDAIREALGRYGRKGVEITTLAHYLGDKQTPDELLRHLRKLKDQGTVERFGIGKYRVAVRRGQ